MVVLILNAIFMQAKATYGRVNRLALQGQCVG